MTVSDRKLLSVRPVLSRTTSLAGIHPALPVTAPPLRANGKSCLDGVLELFDGSAFLGISFGAEGKSVAGECVFQTGMSVMDHWPSLLKHKDRHGGLYRVFD